MKKGKVFSKRHIVTAVLTLCLIAAVWLNMEFSTFDYVTPNNTDSGSSEQQYFDTNSVLGEAVQTAGSVDKINSARNEREASRGKIIDEIKSIINDGAIENSDKADALNKLNTIVDLSVKESNIETLLKSKGFNDALVVMTEDSVSVIIPSEGLLTSETLQIQDAVRSQIQLDLEKIKIITVK